MAKARRAEPKLEFYKVHTTEGEDNGIKNICKGEITIMDHDISARIEGK